MHIDNDNPPSPPPGFHVPCASFRSHRESQLSRARDAWSTGRLQRRFGTARARLQQPGPHGSTDPRVLSLPENHGKPMVLQYRLHMKYKGVLKAFPPKSMIDDSNPLDRSDRCIL